MVPPPFFTIWRNPSRQQKNVPRKLVFITRSNISVVVSAIRPPPPIPALLTSMSMRPNSPMTDWTMASTCWESVTSTVIPRVCRPVASAMAAALFCAFSCWRLVTATLAPASARAWAITNPNPRFPPVINATRPSSLNASRYIEFCSPFGCTRTRRVLALH